MHDCLYVWIATLRKGQKNNCWAVAGTLTQNIMGFVWCSISGKLYGKQAPSDLDTPHAITHDPELLTVLKKSKGEQHEQAVDFLTHLAVCNTVVPATTAAGQLIYQVTHTLLLKLL